MRPASEPYTISRALRPSASAPWVAIRPLPGLAAAKRRPERGDASDFARRNVIGAAGALLSQLRHAHLITGWVAEAGIDAIRLFRGLL
jgi:hypothetical protein